MPGWFRAAPRPREEQGAADADDDVDEVDDNDEIASIGFSGRPRKARIDGLSAP